MEREFGNGRASSICRPFTGWREHERCLPVFRDIPQNRLQIFHRYKEHGLEALCGRSRRPVRYANQLPGRIEQMIVRLKKEKPHWGARKIRELLVRRLAGDARIPARSTVHAVLDRHGLVKRGRQGRRNKAEGTALEWGQADPIPIG